MSTLSNTETLAALNRIMSEHFKPAVTKAEAVAAIEAYQRDNPPLPVLVIEWPSRTILGWRGAAVECEEPSAEQ